MTSKTFTATIVRDGPMCYIPLTFDPKPVFGKLRAPVKVTLNDYTFRSTIAAMGAIAQLASQLGYGAEPSAVADRLSRLLARSDQKFLVADHEERAVGWIHNVCSSGASPTLIRSRCLMAIRVAAQVLLIHSALTLVSASEAFAWGDDGHRMVCEIAFQLLDEAHRNEVIKLTGAYRRPNNGAGFPQFTEGCLFADEARQKARQKTPGWLKFEPFDRWHFLNVTRATPLIAESDCNKNCVLFGITRHIEGLKAAERVDRAEALFFLSHWLGDIHQPLHISYQDDLGGNEITTNGGFYASTHLHGVWDSGIIAKAIGNVGWRIFAQRLARAITPAELQTWIASTPLVWAQESYNITTRPSAQYCRWQPVSGAMSCSSIGPSRTLGEPYQIESSDDVLQRVQQAGARLADLLRRHLVLPSS